MEDIDFRDYDSHGVDCGDGRTRLYRVMRAMPKSTHRRLISDWRAATREVACTELLPPRNH